MNNNELCPKCDGVKNRYGVCTSCERDVFYRNLMIFLSIQSAVVLTIFEFVTIGGALVLCPIIFLFSWISWYPLRRARKNNHAHAWLIGFLNLIFGGTIIGWIILFKWAGQGKEYNLRQTVIEKKVEIAKLERLIKNTSDKEVRDSFMNDIVAAKKELVQLEAEYEEYADPSEDGAETESCEEDILEMYLHELEERIAQLHEEGSYSEAAEEKILAEYSEEVQQMYAERVQV